MDFEFEGKPTPPQRSTFVNVLAWIFIVLGGFTTFISILQNIMIRVMFRKEEMTQAMKQAEEETEGSGLQNTDSVICRPDPRLLFFTGKKVFLRPKHSLVMQQLRYVSGGFLGPPPKLPLSHTNII
ncbi:MAG: hypothetical protein PHP95_11805 [Desulfuromonadaceae bacterium]|nr:hypothetical protein [Desulfuromonadaceae bacterium]MDD2849130.1 hypothetical protein [Desulfuromonadaceae bacterium]MDD4129498.1 hypothetical protein [Desulfuromonadaceae bacterium]